MSILTLYAAMASPFIDDQEKVHRLEPICKTGDWNTWSQILLRERLTAYTYAELSRLGLLQFIPKDLARIWRGHSISLAIQGAKYGDLLRRLIQIADSERLPILCMRTPYLNQRIYGGNLAVRPFSDIDIAVKPEHRMSFVEALREHFQGEFQFRGNQRSLALKSEMGSRMEIEVGELNVDLHWNLTLHYNFCRSLRQAAGQVGIWERSPKDDLPWGTCNVLSDADLLVHLAQHCAVQHDLKDRPFSQLVDFVGLVSTLDDKVMSEGIEESLRDYGCPSALSAMSYFATKYITNAEANPLLSTWGAQLRPTARRTVYGYVTRRGEDFEKLEKKARAPFRVFSTEQRHQMMYMAGVADGGAVRAALFRQYLLPTRATVDYATDRATTLREYLTFLMLYLPIGQLYLLPVVAILIAQHIHDSLVGRSKYVGLQESAE